MSSKRGALFIITASRWLSHMYVRLLDIVSIPQFDTVCQYVIFFYIDIAKCNLVFGGGCGAQRSPLRACFPPPPSGETVKRLSRRDLRRLTVSPARWYTEQMFGTCAAAAAQLFFPRGVDNAMKKGAHRAPFGDPPRRSACG